VPKAHSNPPKADESRLFASDELVRLRRIGTANLSRVQSLFDAPIFPIWDCLDQKAFPLEF
jgi:hypothetical protein